MNYPSSSSDSESETEGTNERGSFQADNPQLTTQDQSVSNQASLSAGSEGASLSRPTTAASGIDPRHRSRVRKIEPTIRRERQEGEWSV